MDELLYIITDVSCRSRLATLNERLSALERRVEYIEARVCIKTISINVLFVLQVSILEKKNIIHMYLDHKFQTNIS